VSGIAGTDSIVRSLMMFDLNGGDDNDDKADVTNRRWS